MTTTLAPEATEARFRRTSADFISEAVSAARVDRVRAREARAMAGVWEQRARRVPGQSTMYLREAGRLRRAAVALEIDAAMHQEAVTAVWQLIDDGLLPPQEAGAETAGRH
jgi:hypothetical protein